MVFLFFDLLIRRGLLNDVAGYSDFFLLFHFKACVRFMNSVLCQSLLQCRANSSIACKSAIVGFS
jgi:hypothetical protein